MVFGTVSQQDTNKPDAGDSRLFECPPLRIGDGVSETPEWACVLSNTVTTTLPVGVSKRFYAGLQLLGRLYENGRLEIYAGYACDGYSPTVRIFRSWLRLTPTPCKAGMFPAILHDFLRQFCDLEEAPWTRENTDTWFYNSLVAGGESKHRAGVYYGAVSRMIGNIWYHFRKQDPTLHIEP